MTSANKPDTNSEFVWDEQRIERTGIAEAVFCQGKSAKQINAISRYHLTHDNSVLFTRLSDGQFQQLEPEVQAAMVYDTDSNTATVGSLPSPQHVGVGIVTAGTSDMSVAYEAAKTLNFNGFDAPVIADVGVAGLWRLQQRLPEITKYKVIIAVAGMEGALFSVLSGLVSSPVIAVPSSVGYGVSAGGQIALQSALGSCAPGLLTVNIDNGFGAAVAAIKMLKSCN